MRNILFTIVLLCFGFSSYAKEPISYTAELINQPYPLHNNAENKKKLKIISIKRYKLSNGEEWLQYRYITNIDLDNRKLLIIEAKKIWPSFRTMSESFGHITAIMAPSKQSNSVFSLKTLSKQIPFKKSNNKWKIKI